MTNEMDGNEDETLLNEDIPLAQLFALAQPPAWHPPMRRPAENTTTDMENHHEAVREVHDLLREDIRTHWQIPKSEEQRFGRHIAGILHGYEAADSDGKAKRWAELLGFVRRFCRKGTSIFAGPKRKVHRARPSAQAFDKNVAAAQSLLRKGHLSRAASTLLREDVELPPNVLEKMKSLPTGRMLQQNTSRTEVFSSRMYGGSEERGKGQGTRTIRMDRRTSCSCTPPRTGRAHSNDW